MAAITAEDLDRYLVNADKKSHLQALRDETDELRLARMKAEEEQRRTQKLPQLQFKRTKASEIKAAIAHEEGLLKQSFDFLNPQLSKMVKCYPKQLMLIGARTGAGKSTTVAMVADSLIRSGKKVLIISNEERQAAVFSRIVCQNQELSYYKKRKSLFSPAEQQKFESAIDSVAEMVEVIDSTHQGRPEFVTSADGLMEVLRAYASNFDAIIIDYFQKVTTDTRTNGNDLEAQAALAAELDLFKEEFHGPTIVFAQLHPSNKEKAEFEGRLKGRKNILVVATDALELIPLSELYRTEVKCHKSRFDGQMNGKSMLFGYDRDLCRLIPSPDKDTAFQTKVVAWKAEQASAELMNESMNGSGTDEDFIDRGALRRQKTAAALAQAARVQAAQDDIMARVNERVRQENDQILSPDFKAGQKYGRHR